MSALTLAPTGTLWTCDGCGKTGEWGPTWASYGSIADMDAGRSHYVVSCSEACRDAAMEKYRTTTYNCWGEPTGKRRR